MTYNHFIQVIPKECLIYSLLHACLTNTVYTNVWVEAIEKTFFFAYATQSYDPNHVEWKNNIGCCRLLCEHGCLNGKEHLITKAVNRENKHFL